MKEKIEVITIADNEQFLRQISNPVDIFNDKELSNDINTLEIFCEETDIALAMASVQLGIPKRLIYLRNTNLDIVNKVQNGSASEEEIKHNEARVIINLVIISREGLTEYWEACGSCLDYFGKVLRPYKIVVEYYDIKGDKYIEIFEGFGATFLSHEIDHLDGILHIDIAEEVMEMSVSERYGWRQTHGYKIYSKTGDYDLLRKQNSNRKSLK